MGCSLIEQLFWAALAAPWHVGSSLTTARTRVCCIGRRILNHCATRKAPVSSFLEWIWMAHIHVCGAGSAFLLVEMIRNSTSSLSFTSWKNYGRGRIMFIQVHLGIYYDTQCNLYLPKPIPNGSDPWPVSLNFYKSVQISLWEKVQLLLLLFIF